MSETFRLKKSVKYLGMVFTAVFLAAVVASASVFFLEDPARHGFKDKYSVAVVGGMGLLVYGTMLLMSAWYWAAYYVERFTIDGATLSIRSMRQLRQFDVSELACLTWKVPQGGSIAFRVMGVESRLDLQEYSHDDRLRIIESLRDLVPAARQEGWPRFCHKVALPLRDGRPSPASREPSPDSLLITRGRYDRWAAVGVPLAIIVAVALWVWLDLWQFVVLPPLVVAAWLVLRFDVPADGRIERRLSSTVDGRVHLIAWSAIIGAMLLMLGLRLWGVEKAIACWAGCVVMGAAFPPILYLLHKADKQQRIADEKAAKSAPEQWLQGSADGGMTMDDGTAGW